MSPARGVFLIHESVGRDNEEMRRHRPVGWAYFGKIWSDDICDYTPAIIDAQHVDRVRPTRLEAELRRVEIVIFAVSFQRYRSWNIFEGGEGAKVYVKLLFF